MKKVLIFTDQKKCDVLIAERRRFAQELNDGIDLLTNLPFVEPEQCPTLEELKKPIEWWNGKILLATAPKIIRGFSPDPRQQALVYSVQYDQHVKDIHRYPWNAISLVDYVDGRFEVLEATEEKVRKESSTFGTSEQAKVFSDLENL